MKLSVSKLLATAAQTSCAVSARAEVASPIERRADTGLVVAGLVLFGLAYAPVVATPSLAGGSVEAFALLYLSVFGPDSCTAARGGLGAGGNVGMLVDTGAQTGGIALLYLGRRKDRPVEDYARVRVASFADRDRAGVFAVGTF